jgi:hypothetical protein
MEIEINKSEIETSKLNAISIHQSACMFHHIQRYHKEFRNELQIQLLPQMLIIS